ncbi:MAG: tetratricopeptide repeat protein [Maribacter sp.]
MQSSEYQLAHYELGKLFLKINRAPEGKAVFTHLADAYPGNTEYHYHLGEAYSALDERKVSLEHYNKAVQLDSTHLRSLFQLAKYHTIKQERDNALRYIDKGLEFYGNDVALINLKALVLYNDFQYKNAIPLFERVLELGETKDYVYEKLGDCYTKNWEFEKAKEMYGILLQRNDANSQTYFDLASVYWKEEKLDSAKALIKKGMEVQKPIFAYGYTTLADIARQEKDMETALQFYKLAHEEDANDARIFYNICTVVDQIRKDPKEKLDYYEKFIKYYPNEHPYFYESVRKRIRELKEQIHFTND